MYVCIIVVIVIITNISVLLLLLLSSDHCYYIISTVTAIIIVVIVITHKYQYCFMIIIGLLPSIYSWLLLLHIAQHPLLDEWGCSLFNFAIAFYWCYYYCYHFHFHHLKPYLLTLTKMMMVVSSESDNKSLCMMLASRYCYDRFVNARVMQKHKIKDWYLCVTIIITKIIKIIIINFEC